MKFPWQHREAFEIDAICAPFSKVVPTDINAPKHDAQLLGTGSDKAREIFPRMRVEMLAEIFAEFRQRENIVRNRIPEYRQSIGLLPSDAIYVAIMSVFEDSMKHAAEHNAAFRETRKQYERLHRPEDYSPRTGDAPSELRAFSGHGTGVMIGLLEVAPTVYENARKLVVDRAKLRELIPGSADKLFTSLTRVRGPFAIAVENAMMRDRHHIGYEDVTFTRYVFNPDMLTMRTVDGKDMLDVTKAVRKNFHTNILTSQLQYHGCLGGFAKMPRDESVAKRQTVFTYVKNLSSELLLEHAFPGIKD